MIPRRPDTRSRLTCGHVAAWGEAVCLFYQRSRIYRRYDMSVTSVSELTGMGWTTRATRTTKDGISVLLKESPTKEVFKVEVRDPTHDGEDIDVYVIDPCDVHAAYSEPFTYAAAPGAVAVPPDGYQREPLRSLDHKALDPQFDIDLYHHYD